MHVDPFAQNHAGTEKSDAGDALGRDAGRITLPDHRGEDDKMSARLKRPIDSIISTCVFINSNGPWKYPR
jgi:hypothetical protein